MRREALLGRWTLSRKILDTAHEQIGAMWGTAHFQDLDDQKVLYKEEVNNNSQFFAYQHYLFLFKDKEIEIHRGKEENVIPFFKLPYHKKMIDGYHYCKPDLYTLRWVWVHPRLFYTRFAVKGLRKNYTLETHFRK